MASVFFRGKEFLVLDGVYEPSDDSFLLAESIKVKEKASALDLGTGSGIQGINAAMLKAGKVVCTDVNARALENARLNAESLGFGKGFEFRQGSLFSCIGRDEKFDLMVFNPPYVVSGEKKDIDLDGGRKGREILDLFLKQFGKHLGFGGECFFLQSSLNGRRETEEILGEEGLAFEIVSEKKLFFEKLLVFRAWKARGK